MMYWDDIARFLNMKRDDVEYLVESLKDKQFILDYDADLISINVALHPRVLKKIKNKLTQLVDDEEVKQQRFKVPDPDEVTEYAKSIDFVLDGAKFCNYYEARGWQIGKFKMRDWKAAVRTWKINDSRFKKETQFHYDQPRMVL